jgi:hypothetical protein
VSEGVHESLWLQGMMAGRRACYFCIENNQQREARGLQRRAARMCTTEKDRVNADLLAFIKG